jgi:hypothetical protein
MLPSMDFEIVSADDMPSWVLQPLPGHIQDAIAILEAAIAGLKGRGYRVLNSAICYLWDQPVPSDGEWLREMGIAP